MRVFRPVAAAFLAALALSSCSSDSKSDSADPSPTVAATPTTVTAAAGAPASDQELEALLVSTVPGGFVQQTDDVGDTGPSDLAKAVRDDPTEDGEQALRDEGFVRGYQRLWLGPADAEIIVFLYQFETPAGAQADFDRTKGFLSADSLPGATTFTVDGIPATQSAGIAASAPTAAAAVVQFHTGVYNVQIVGNGPVLPGLQARVSSIAKDQLARL